MHPTLDLWNPDIIALYADKERIRCSTDEHWVLVINSTFHITERASRDHGNITCRYAPLKRRPDDFTLEDDETINIKHGDPITSDFLTVRCVGDLSKKTYENVHSGIYKKKIEVRPMPTDAMGFNVMILGVDSVSRMAWRRLFPETYSYFKDTLGGIVLEGYNVVGDGTVANLLPFLCGKNLKELPESRRGKPNAKPVNGYPWVWKAYEKTGYMTQFIEDRPDINTFNLQLMGFNEQPVHHYMRPFFLKAIEKRSAFDMCLGSKRLHVNAMNWVQQFFTAYKNKPKFSFIHLNAFTHDAYKFAGDADKDLLAFIHAMKSQGDMSNTLFLLMSDHGPRFEKARQAAHGRAEERMPFMGLLVPLEFTTKYPIAFRNLRINSHRLTTPFDIYETLMDVVKFRKAYVGNLSDRGISLFKEIPQERTCLQAGVSTHWCACQELKSMPINDSVVQRASIKLVATINSITSGFRNVCHLLTLSHITKSAVYTQDETIVLAKSEVYYSITVMTTPGNGMFEATIKYNTLLEQFIVLKQDISRINTYGNQSSCIVESDPSLLAFCNCHEQ